MARKPESSSNSEAATKPEPNERFVHLGSGCFLDRKTGHVIIL
jgi:hypothetical protein